MESSLNAQSQGSCTGRSRQNISKLRLEDVMNEQDIYFPRKINYVNYMKRQYDFVLKDLQQRNKD